MGTCDQSETQTQQLILVSVTVTEPGNEQEQTLIKGFEKKVSLNENDNVCTESWNLEGDSNGTKYEYPSRTYAEDCPYNLRPGNPGGDSTGTKHEYPLRPYAEDCPYYLRTGYCKFGFNCKFNHPARRGFQEKEKGGFAEQPGQIQCKFYQNAGGCKYGGACRFNHSIEKSDIPPPELNAFGLPIQLEKEEEKSKGFVEKTGEIECKYHLSAGGCKYGNTCKFSHSNEKSCRYVKRSEIAPPKLNFLGLPIRMLEKECPFYMRNGSCKYGLDCRFNHPDPVAAGGSDSLNSTTAGLSLGGHSSENRDGESDPLQLIRTQPAMESWSSKMTSNRTVPYLDNHPSHAPGMHLNSNWTRHEGSIFPNTKTRLPHSVPAVDYQMKTTNVSTYHRQEVEEFPERPGQPECDYFMKTGNCKYNSACKFHHPRSRSSKPSVCTLSNSGLPLRPDKKICWNFEKYGICKYGPNCLFDHPENSHLSAYASGCNTETFAETKMAGFEGGNKTLIQQSV
ncbi:hypothetical protein Q3G72_030302 [Acer saccharum]|nr:hypothetical protein Q3G72_030302 [Acer saccharum]